MRIKMCIRDRLTGDNERTARAVGKQAGVDEVIAGVDVYKRQAHAR